jgi:mRNA-degrading endonuclease RelE of RelBE toxin-antitoxin system
MTSLNHQEDGKQYSFIFAPEFDRALRLLKKKKPSLFSKVSAQIEKVLRAPILGKPLRNVLRNYLKERTHVESAPSLVSSV